MRNRFLNCLFSYFVYSCFHETCLISSKFICGISLTLQHWLINFNSKSMQIKYHIGNKESLKISIYFQHYFVMVMKRYTTWKFTSSNTAWLLSLFLARCPVLGFNLNYIRCWILWRIFLLVATTIAGQESVPEWCIMKTISPVISFPIRIARLCAHCVLYSKFGKVEKLVDSKFVRYLWRKNKGTRR